jgi:hypothetical protein
MLAALTSTLFILMTLVFFGFSGQALAIIFDHQGLVISLSLSLTCSPNVVTRLLLVLPLPRSLLDFCLVRSSECIGGNSRGGLVIRVDIRRSWSTEW